MKLLLVSLISSSLGRKYIMAATGLAAVGFLLTHLGGNLLIFAGPERFNDYAHHLHSFVLLPALEMGLFALFAVHALFGVILTVQNWRARPVRYAMKRKTGAGDVASRTMIYSGIGVLVFLAIHMWTVNFGVPESMSSYDRVVGALTNPVGVISYVLGILVLGLHLYHGVSSTLNSLGLYNAKFDGAIGLMGKAVAIAFAVCFISIPVFVGIFVRRLG